MILIYFAFFLVIFAIQFFLFFFDKFPFWNFPAQWNMQFSFPILGKSHFCKHFYFWLKKERGERKEERVKSGSNNSNSGKSNGSNGNNSRLKYDQYIREKSRPHLNYQQYLCLFLPFVCCRRSLLLLLLLLLLPLWLFAYFLCLLAYFEATIWFIANGEQ